MSVDHSTTLRFLPIPEFDDATKSRFWAKVNKLGPIPEVNPSLGPCWIWKASLGRGGYGGFYAGRKRYKAARVAYAISTGNMPTDLVPDHLCRVHACVRPSHLEAITFRENILRGTAPSALSARRTKCKRGHPLDGSFLLYGRYRVRRCKTCHAKNERDRHAQLSRPQEPPKVCVLCHHSLEDNQHGFDQNDAEVAGEQLVHSGTCTYCKICNPRMRPQEPK